MVRDALHTWDCLCVVCVYMCVCVCVYVVVLVLCCWHTIHQVFRSIGYKSVKVDKDIPFDHNKGIVLNEKGRIVSGEQHVTLRHPCVCVRVNGCYLYYLLL